MSGHEWSVGDMCEARQGAQNVAHAHNLHNWKPGTIERISESGEAADVKFDDGETEAEVPLEFIRQLDSSVSPSPLPGRSGAAADAPAGPRDTGASGGASSSSSKKAQPAGSEVVDEDEDDAMEEVESDDAGGDAAKTKDDDADYAEEGSGEEEDGEDDDEEESDEDDEEWTGKKPAPKEKKGGGGSSSSAPKEALSAVGKRKVKPTTMMIGGHAVKRQNLYGMEEGEGSVWDRELSGKTDANFAYRERPAASADDEAESKKERKRAKQAGSEKVERRPREKTAEEKERIERNEGLKQAREAAQATRARFLQPYASVLAKFGAKLPKVPKKKSKEEEEGLEGSGNGFLINETIVQPSQVNGVTMRDYQLHGMRWLAAMHQCGVNAILADESTRVPHAMHTHARTRTPPAPHTSHTSFPSLLSLSLSCSGPRQDPPDDLLPRVPQIRKGRPRPAFNHLPSLGPLLMDGRAQALLPEPPRDQAAFVRSGGAEAFNEYVGALYRGY